MAETICKVSCSDLWATKCNSNTILTEWGASASQPNSFQNTALAILIWTFKLKYRKQFRTNRGYIQCHLCVWRHGMRLQVTRSTDCSIGVSAIYTTDCSRQQCKWKTWMLQYEVQGSHLLQQSESLPSISSTQNKHEIKYWNNLQFCIQDAIIAFFANIMALDGGMDYVVQAKVQLRCFSRWCIWSWKCCHRTAACLCTCHTSPVCGAVWGQRGVVLLHMNSELCCTSGRRRAQV